jgi:hypothetical protein
MDKKIDEEDLKALDEEIDKAIGKMFVPKDPSLIQTLSPKAPSFEPSFESEAKPAAAAKPSFEMMESSILELSSEMEKSFDAIPPSEEEEIFRPVDDERAAPSAPAPPPPPVSLEPLDARTSLERLEGHLLTLEWEINKENLEKTKQEVRALKQGGEGGAPAASILACMEKVLNRMISHGDAISPAFTKFLMDSKETLKLFLGKEAERGIEPYQRLVLEGIEARFTCLELSSGGPATAALSLQAEEMPREDSKDLGGTAVEEIVARMSAYYEKVETGLKKVNDHLALLGEWVRHAPASLETKRGVPEALGPAGMSLTLVRVDEKFFGVPSDKVFKLFRIPLSRGREVINQPSIRLKEMDVKIADLRKLFSLAGSWKEKEPRLLIVQHAGKYKGLVIEQVLPRISFTSGVERASAPYSCGTLRWTYEGRPVEVLILDVSQF